VDDAKDGFRFIVREDVKTQSAVIEVYDSTSRGTKVLEYGTWDGEPVLEPEFDKAPKGSRYVEALASMFKSWQYLWPLTVPEDNLPSPPAEVEEAMEKFHPGTSKRPGSTSYRGDVFRDPALEDLRPAMTDQEKIFTTIQKWDGDLYTNTASSLDQGARKVLAEKPEGTGHYFEWSYISPEESAQMSNEDIKKQGFTISKDQGALMVTRLSGWKTIEDEVWKQRRQSRLA
jgi:hypothetical protein